MLKSINNALRLKSNQIIKSGSLQRTSIPTTTKAIRTFTSVHTAVCSTGTSRNTLRPLNLPIIVTPKHEFSTAAQEEEETSTPPPESKSKSQQRQRPKRKDPIIITPAAAVRIKELLSSPNGQGAIGIRLGVKRRGCNGLSYTLNYAFEKESNEEAMEAHGVKVVIEPMALFSVVGTVMDWVETDMSSEFTFENPNSKGECGCGESFNV
jgi:iron-sulfur cluster assembly accessory protein